MFEVKAPETIPTTITVVGQGREQKLALVYKTKTRDEYQALLEKLREGKAAMVDVLLELVDSWQADIPLDRDGILLLQQQQPMCDYAILLGYGDAHTVSRKGN
jgi:hypothetical protein